MTKKDKEKIKELITFCKIYRYDTTETLNYLKENGHEISDRTLRRIKNEMNSNVSQRFIEIAKYEFIDEIFHSLDTLKIIEKECWNLLSKNPSINERIRIFDSIHKIQNDIITMLNDTPLIQKFKDVLDARLAEIKNPVLK